MGDVRTLKKSLFFDCGYILLYFVFALFKIILVGFAILCYPSINYKR